MLTITKAKELMIANGDDPQVIDWASYNDDEPLEDYLDREYHLSLRTLNGKKDDMKALMEEMKVNESKPKANDEVFIENLAKKSMIVLIMGKRGSGKTALGFYLLEQLKGLTARKMFTVGFPEPTPFKDYATIESVPSDSIVLIDEGSIKFDARRSLTESNVSMSNILKIARHNNISVIFITQNTADIEVRTLRMADVFLLKEPSLVQEYMERSIIKRIYQFINPIFTNKDADHNAYYYIFSDSLRGLYQFDLPSFWNEDISKAHKTKKSIIPNLFDRFKKAKLPNFLGVHNG